MNTYSPLEEKLNIYSHLFGVVLGFIALFLFIIKATNGGSVLEVLSNLIFCLSMIFLYSISTKYHSATDTKKRFRLKILDHSAIYVLIAGTYTPYALNVIKGTNGWILFAVSWGLALVGTTLKVFFTGRYKLVSTLMYVFMGWMIVFYIKPLSVIISKEGFNWLLIGGVSYTLGALIYLIKKIPLNHATFHIFVLLGSISHFISIFFYI